MAQAYYLTADDVAVLKRMKALLLGQPRLPGVVSRPPDDHYQTPRNYVVLTPVGGIPRLKYEFTFGDVEPTGTGTGSGSGTGIGELNTPGEADCEVYSSVVYNGVKNLIASGFEITVLNLMTVAIPGNIWVLAIMDAYGDFYVSPIPLNMDTC